MRNPRKPGNQEKEFSRRAGKKGIVISP